MLTLQAKDRAEERVKELLAEKHALLEQLREEKEGRIQAMASAMRRRRESAALKQMIEAVGCKIRINNLAPHSLDASDDDSSPDGCGDRAQASSTTALAEDENSSDERGQLSVSVSIQPDMDATTDVYRRPDYNSNCRLRPGESCRWPQTGCARIGSAFIGLRADFAALERLAILESYFDSEQQPDLQGERDVQQPPLHVSGVT